MSDPRLDALAETARNRGLKLVRSRVRTPGKRRFGKVGLTSASGKPMFGMDAKGPVATPEAVEDYLRSLEAEDWGASLDAPEPHRAKVIGPRPMAADRAVSRHVPPPPVQLKRKAAPPPKPEIRNARPSDAARLAELIHELGHVIGESDVRRNLTALARRGETPLIANLGKAIVGMCGIEKRIVISRAAPVGRISALIVTADAQGKGIGRMLLDAAEAWMLKQGCELVEVTSNDRLSEAHAFYRHMGFERTSIRFAKTLRLGR